MTLLLLLACHGATDDTGKLDTVDTGETAETGETGESGETGDSGSAEGLAGAWASFVGGSTYATGSSLVIADVNGDGAKDAVIGAYYAERACWFPGPVAAGDYGLDGAAGCWTGEGAYDFAAYTMVGVGDADGDGADDLLVGSVGNGDNGATAGKAYLVTGPAPAGDVSLAESCASWAGELGGDYAGIGLAAAGDVTGDGAPDYLVGASGNDAGGAGGGKAYLIPGPVTCGAYQLAEAETSFYGAANSSGYFAHGSLGGGDLVGDSMTGPGDVSGDGIDDIVLGAAGNALNGANTGMAVVFHGPVPSGTSSVYDADLLLYGAEASWFVGSPVNAAGDLSGDGINDFLVSADGVSGGSVFLVVGSDMTGGRVVTEGPVQFTGEADQDQAGAAVSAPGDLTGDGSADVAIGAPANDRTGLDAGAVYVLAGPFSAGAYGLADAASILPGESVADNAGGRLAGGGDVTGDGRADLLVGAQYNDDGGAFSGKAYLLAGW